MDDTPPISAEYRLTTWVQALLPALGELTVWAENNLA
ncbi:hypothetical protein QMK17_07720 [Rhodococcus sp. G-MC3]|nr:hypothetical protein [Rhodococcus sp. G-MC3]MDJ0393217.1 hypothetical protein [Rhodococcus sp. G-MC3]